MATAAEAAPVNDNSTDATSVTISGFLTKEGGTYRTWKKRYFVLEGTELRYYKKEGDPAAKGTIDLTKGRGVRRKQDTKNVQWPDEAKASVTFALAVEGRTYYVYGTDSKEIGNWRQELTSVIQEHGQPNDNWEEDCEGLPEPALSKAIRGATKMGADLVKKFAKDSGVVDEDTANIIEGVSDGVKNQAEADHNTSIKDRAKMAVGDTAGVVGDNVDNDVVGVACDVIKEQAEADDDTTMGQRLGMATGTALQGASGMVDNDIGAGVMNTAGGIIHDQAEADPDASIGERIAIGVGSAAAGIGDAVDNDEVKLVTKGVEKGAEKVSEKLAEKREEEAKEEEKEDEDED